MILNNRQGGWGVINSIIGVSRVGNSGRDVKDYGIVNSGHQFPIVKEKRFPRLEQRRLPELKLGTTESSRRDDGSVDSD